MIIKISPDREKAKSIIVMVNDRKKFISSTNIEQFPNIAVENYYDIISELATAILLSDGLKAIGENAHKETLEALSKFKEFAESEMNLMDDLRIKRNKSRYEGKQIHASYIENKKQKILLIIEKLEKLAVRKDI